MKLRTRTAVGWFVWSMLARIQFEGASDYPQSKDAEANSNG